MIASVQKAVRILTAVADAPTSPTPLCEIAERTGICKPTCSHLVSTLVHEGFLVKISASKGYILGPAAYCLSHDGRYGSDLISVCRPVMQYLHKALSYSVVLAVIEGGTKYLIDYIDDGQIFKQKRNIRKDDLYRTATGRAILGSLPAAELAAIWEKQGAPTGNTWPEITSFDQLLAYAASDKPKTVSTREKHEDGSVILGYAQPLKRKEECVGAIGIAVKLSKEEEKSFLSQKEKNVKEILSRGAAVISKRL